MKKNYGMLLQIIVDFFMFFGSCCSYSKCAIMLVTYFSGVTPPIEQSCINPLMHNVPKMVINTSILGHYALKDFCRIS